MENKLPYYSLNTYFKNKYNTRVQKITVSLPFFCPHIDKKTLKGGCTYCYKGSMPPSNNYNTPLEEQIKIGIERAKYKYGKNIKFLVYFQSYSNTCADIDKLKKTYDTAFKFDNVIGIDIGTRPDCINLNILKLLDSYIDSGYEVWIEYGLESSNDNTLKRVNRGHTVEDFIRAVKLTKENTRLKIISHIIIGFPWETKKDFLNSIELINFLKLDGIKIHPLYIMDDTEMGKEYKEKKFKLLSLEEYIEILVELVENLSKDIILMRFTAEGDKKKLLAPEYCVPEYKSIIKNLLIEKLIKRTSYQGKKAKGGKIWRL